MNICITINMKNKLLKIKGLDIIYFEERRLSTLSSEFYKMLNSKNCQTINILIESKCMDSIKILREIEKSKKNVKVVILYFNNINFSKYKPIRNIYFINLQQVNFEKQLLNRLKYKKGKGNERNKSTINQRNEKKDINLRNQKESKYMSAKNKSYENFKINNKINKSIHLDKYNPSWNKKSNPFTKNKNAKRTVISLSLDNKVYSTTYLLNYCMILAKTYKTEVNFFEKEQSLIMYDKLIDLNKNNIKYEKFSIIDVVSIKDKNVNIVDLGKVDNLDFIKEVLQNEYLKVIVFVTDCLKANENDKFLKILRFLEKHNEVIIINRKDIFDKKIQENTNRIKSRIIIKNIKKRRLLKGEYV